MVSHLSRPFTILFYVESTVLPVLVSLYVHKFSVQTKRKAWQMLFEFSFSTILNQYEIKALATPFLRPYFDGRWCFGAGDRGHK
jgi:hypothetical protein